MNYFAVSVSRNQTSPLGRKPRIFRTFSAFQGPNQEEGGIFETLHQLIDCTLDDGGSEQVFTWYSLLSQSSDIKLHHFDGQKWRFRWVLQPETTMMV